MKRPLLQSITQPTKPVLLIDEIDRSDEEFESFLLEVLSEWQITIPEIGTIRASQIPQVILTSNRTRELSEALRRRCLYLYIDYPDFDKECTIIKCKIPGIDEKLGEQITRFMQELRTLKIQKTPGLTESLDWARALASLHIDHLDKSIIEQTLGVVIKDWKDTRDVQLSLNELMEKAGIHSRISES
jgi:MoxR-like ATPase